jgi:hypothetical protein
MKAADNSLRLCSQPRRKHQRNNNKDIMQITENGFLQIYDLVNGLDFIQFMQIESRSKSMLDSKNN